MTRYCEIDKVTSGLNFDVNNLYKIMSSVLFDDIQILGIQPVLRAILIVFYRHSL